MQVDQAREILRQMDREAVEHLAWLMRVHAALMFEDGTREVPPPLEASLDPCCGAKGEEELVASLARSRAAMHRQAKALVDSGRAAPENYGAFMAAVDAYARDAKRLEGHVRRQLAETDPLTGLHNRQGMMRDLRREWTRATRTGQTACIAIADLDFFKAVNDTWGHAAGDRVLCMAARFFSRRLRPYDLVYRYGGEEFLFCLPDTDAETARRVLDRLRMLMARLPVSLDCGARVAVTCSIGMAQMIPGRTVQEALAAADQALYAAKEAGRNRVEVAPQPVGVDGVWRSSSRPRMSAGAPLG